jgi:peptidyl-tRNA hydrolase, PTH1 family
MFLIVGQGNPGVQYANTKHNVGFWVLDRLGGEFRPKGKAFIHELSTRGWLMKPATFYNATGLVVAPFARFYKIPP